MNSLLYSLLFFTFIIGSCGTDDNPSTINNETDEMIIDNPETDDEALPIIIDNNEAKIVSVNITGETANYTFNVGVSSPDTGCNQYANWWEIVTEEGVLVYRRILMHSHVNEQPFVRSGSAINATENQTLIVRAHMSNSGYGTQVYKGSVALGFSEMTVAADFANDLATKSPLPDGCAF